MSEGGNKLPFFDPSEAIREGLAILDEAGARFALAGCLASWSYVPAAAGEQDEQDIRWILKAVSREEYRELRGVVLARAGYTAMMVLDKVARRIGHPGAEPETRN